MAVLFCFGLEGGDVMAWSGIRGRLDGWDDRVLRFDRLVPSEGSVAMRYWADMDEGQRGAVERAAYHGQAVTDPRDALVWVALTEPQARRVRARRGWLVLLLMGLAGGLVGVVLAEVGPALLAIGVMAVLFACHRLLLDMAFERIREQNRDRARPLIVDGEAIF